jgi:hypothetical protein
MLPLVSYLPRRNANPADRADRPDLPAIKGITAPRRLSMHFRQIGVDGGSGRWVGAETLELGVAPITPCPPAQNCLCKKRFTPKGDQTLRIEIAGMDGP